MQSNSVIVDMEEAPTGKGEIRRMQDGLVSNYQSHMEIEASCCERILTYLSWMICIIVPVFWFYIWRTVKEYERALIFRFGKIVGKAQGPGLFVINPLIDVIVVVDLRIITCNLVPQKMMTKDSVTCTVDAVVFMKVCCLFLAIYFSDLLHAIFKKKVSDPIRAILEVDNYRNAFQNIAATTLRGVIGKYDLETIISERNVVNKDIRQIIEEDTSSWGVKVPSVEIRDVTLPLNMQRAMAAASEAEREREAKVISALGEAQAAEKLAEAARIASSAPGTLQLRYLHTLVKISAEKNSTILFPLPMEVMRGIQMFGDVMERQLKRDDVAANAALPAIQEEE